MIDILLTSAVLLLLAAAIFPQNKPDDGTFFLKKEYTSWLMGLCAIVVIMVHFSEPYQNPLQDLIGSFAFVAVMFFFLISAYGMQYSVEHKPDYLKHFWRNRLVSLVTPCIIINIFRFAYYSLTRGQAEWRELLHLYGYVLVLLQYCLLFFVVIAIARKTNLRQHWITDALLISGVASSSLYIYLSTDDHAISADLGWCYERWGLIFGLLLYRFRQPITRWLNDKRIQKTAVMLITCLILGVAYLKWKQEWFYGEFCLKIILGLAIITFTFLLTQKRAFGNRFSHFLSSISYEVYLSHGFVMAVLAEWWPGMRSGLFVLLTFAATFIFSFLVHAISSRLVKRWRTK